MAKDRNTFAKHQRALEKKHKADKKRERCAKKSQAAEVLPDPDGSPTVLSPAERSVLDVFRTSQISPEAVFSFSPADLEAFKLPLAELADKGLLVAEKSAGDYTLTEIGIATMNNGELPRR